MAKRLSENEKIVLVKYFNEGITIDELAKKFSCTKLTITRNIKKNIGEEKYKKLIDQNRKTNEFKEKIEKNQDSKVENYFDTENNEKPISNNLLNDQEDFQISHFAEIAPLTLEIDNAVQKDFASIPISEMDFPSVVYMIVDKKIELQIKYLKEYPEWQFLSNEELNRKTIEIFFDLKTAKRFCNKEQKVIKVPNTEVFQIAAPFLLNKGISRIVTADRLISL